MAIAFVHQYLALMDRAAAEPTALEQETVVA
jgi:hypothetical protein